MRNPFKIIVKMKAKRHNFLKNYEAVIWLIKHKEMKTKATFCVTDMI